MRAVILALGAATVVGGLGGLASGQVISTYEDLTEGFYGESFTHNGVTYRDVNQVSGFFPDGNPMVPDDLGTVVMVERAVFFYDDFPDYGSPNNALTFGRSYVVGDNLSIGAISSVWMDLATLSNAASFDIAFYENGPWGGIEYRLEALNDGAVVASDSFIIAGDDPEGRDNATFRTMSVDGAEFDQLHLYAWLDGNYTGPRGMIDNLAITAVPEPTAAIGAGLVGGLLALRRRRA